MLAFVVWGSGSDGFTRWTRSTGVAAGGLGTRVAHAAEHHLHRLDPEVAPVTGGDPEVGDVDEDVAHVAAARADEVVVRILDVRVDADRAGADVEDGDLPHRLEIVHGLVDGLEGDRGHLRPGGLVQRFHRRVVHRPVEEAEDGLALGRDAVAVLAEPGGELVDRLHGGHAINKSCYLEAFYQTRS